MRRILGVWSKIYQNHAQNPNLQNDPVNLWLMQILTDFVLTLKVKQS